MIELIKLIPCDIIINIIEPFTRSIQNPNILQDIISFTQTIPSVYKQYCVNLYNILNSQQLKTNEIEYYYYFKNRRWDLVFSNGLTLKLPAKNKKDSIKIFKKLIDNDKLTNAKIIDLRVHNQIVLTNKNE